MAVAGDRSCGWLLAQGSLWHERTPWILPQFLHSGEWSSTCGHWEIKISWVAGQGSSKEEKEEKYN